MSSDVLAINSAHNFGIYTKSGKRTIFQIDFSCRRVSFIERGKIAKSFDFANLETYDSEENLHIVLRFHGNKTLELDADTAEEKYTICRLLGIILGAEQIETNGTEARENGFQHLSTRKQVIKEGILDKKGNTKIPTWSRRRLQVCPGEFSYYKPGDDVALNLVQLWENCTTITKNGHGGFVVALKDRSYHFRLNNEKGINIEQEREKWIQAFQQASQRKRDTFLLLEMSKQHYYVNNAPAGSPLTSQPINYGEESDIAYYSQGNTDRSTISSGSSTSGKDFQEGLQVIRELDEVLNEESASGRPRSIALSTVINTSPALDFPNKSRVKPPAIGNSNLNGKSEDSDDQGLYEFIPEPDYSPPPSPTPSPVQEQEQMFGGHISRDKQASGVYKSVIVQEKIDTNFKESGKYTKVIGTNMPQRKPSGEYSRSIKPAPVPGVVNVMPNFNETSILRKVSSGNKVEEKIEEEPEDSGQYSARDYVNTRNTIAKANVNVKQMQANIENTYINDVNEKCLDKSVQITSPREKTKVAPPPPLSGSSGLPTVPSALPPPLSGFSGLPTVPSALPPPLSGFSGLPTVPSAPPLPSMGVPSAPPVYVPCDGKGKLKQVHWTRTPKPLVANSIWERARDMTSRLNIRLLEQQFALKERDVPASSGLKLPTGSKQQPLIDSKRAQILDIFMSGLKVEGTRKLIDILNSVTEDDSFPVEKLTTIRRYQPTEDEIDMYKAYAHKKNELHPVDQFMLELCEIPCLSIRIDICLTLWEFPWQYESTCQLVEQVHVACDELLGSEMLVLVLEYLLAIGNHLNRNWSEQNVSLGFQVTSLDKVLSIRGKDSGYTLLNFLVDQLQISDPGLLQWPETVQTVKKCEQVSVKSVVAEIEVLRGDLSKIKKHVKTLKSSSVYTSRQDNKFQQDAQNLTVEYEMKLEKLDRRCGELQNKYRKILTRFGEPLYQRSDEMFAVIADFSERFKTAVKDSEPKIQERKMSAS